MTRREWLILLLAFLIIAGGAAGLYLYRSGEGAGTPPPAPPAERPDATGETVHLWITRDFGGQTLFAEEVAIEADDTVMDVLMRYGGEVKTAYGGGFVEAIQGLASAYRPGDDTSKKLDWFYYVNGTMADIGAAEFPVKAGDVIWWDYHDWSHYARVPAAVGSYPHPFQLPPDNRARELTIMHAPAFQAEAERLAKQIAADTGRTPALTAWDESVFQEERELILVTDAKQLAASPFIIQLQGLKEQSGLLAGVSDEGIVAYSAQGQPTRTCVAAGCGLLMATTHPVYHLPLWILAGMEKEGLDKAIQSLQPFAGRIGEAPGRYFAVLFSEGGMIRLPEQTGGTP